MSVWTEDMMLNQEASWRAETARAMDYLAYALPSLAAVLGIATSIAAFKGADVAALACGIVGAIASGAGVVVTGLTSRNRDRQLSIARSAAFHSLEEAGKNSSQF